ncbi:hypothetical protein OSB04_007528 [Centaurea solstitialis]|uniref:Uncharacterized protein n=1 Tax=Centaurea solstitialis TaxID=347529 RepID=A0AA38TSL7_9ASTR|nr:hypothetical protein OSB04_007528 [Centaurea solstitialis]
MEQMEVYCRRKLMVDFPAMDLRWTCRRWISGEVTVGLPTMGKETLGISPLNGNWMAKLGVVILLGEVSNSGYHDLMPCWHDDILLHQHATLQRSAYSFRRQGSSGRIWDNRLTIGDLKSGDLNADTDQDKSTHDSVQFKKTSRSSAPRGSKNTMKTNNIVSTLSSTSTHQKTNWSRLSSIFTRCISFPSSVR